MSILFLEKWKDFRCLQTTSSSKKEICIAISRHSSIIYKKNTLIFKSEKMSKYRERVILLFIHMIQQVHCNLFPLLFPRSSTKRRRINFHFSALVWTFSRAIEELTKLLKIELFLAPQKTNHTWSLIYFTIGHSIKKKTFTILHNILLNRIDVTRKLFFGE
jgi:hypothetical protein